jgi:hypothetical protein
MADAHDAHDARRVVPSGAKILAYWHTHGRLVMMLRHLCGALCLVVLLSVSAAQLALSVAGGAEESGGSESLPPAAMLGSREMAALIVAYEDYRTWLKDDGVDLTLAEFIKRHHAVWVRREGSQIHIYFYPASELTAGGGVRYLVDAERLQVTERIGER